MAHSAGNSTTAPPVHPVPERAPATRAEVEARRSALVLTSLFVMAATVFLLLPDALQARSAPGTTLRLILLRDVLFVAVIAVLSFVLVRRLLLSPLHGG